MAFNESGGHWYTASGSPCHSIPKKNGKGEKAVNINDARALHLLPSVTTILSTLSKPQLQRWRERQVAMAALTYPKKPEDVLDDAYLDKIISDAFVQVEDAADLGKGIHKALEQYFSDQPHDPALDGYVESVNAVFKSQGIHVMQRELTLVNKAEGYAGQTDLLIDSPHGIGVGDYKTRRSKPQYPMSPWDDQPTQVAAYHQAQFGNIGDNAAGFNLFISTTEPGRVEIYWYDPETLREEWEVFRNLCAVWRLRKKYDPRIQD